MECDAPPRLIELRGGNAGEIVTVEDVGVEPVLQKTRHDGAGYSDVEPGCVDISRAAELRGSCCDIAGGSERPGRDGHGRSGAGSGSDIHG